MRRSVTTLVAGLAATLALGACSSAASDTDGPTIEVEHAQGTTEVPEDPQRIIVFDIASLDTIDALGGTVTGVPKKFLPDFLEEYRGDEYLDAGTLFEPDYEAVNEAEPDLIVVAGRSASAYEDLSDIAPTIDLTVDAKDYLGSFRERTETLAEVLGKQAEATEALDALDARVAEVREQVSDAGEGLVVLTTGGKVSAYGPGSRFGNVIHDTLGVPAADPGIEADTHGEAVSFEYVAETDPEWLFVVDRDVVAGREDGEAGAAAAEVLDNDVVARSTAWRKDQVVYLDPLRWYSAGAGLTSVSAMVEQVAAGVR